ASGSNRTPARPAGGGMALLSRPRSSQKVGTKLAVPPPLNLPSLRKEHERFDSLGSGGGQAGGAGSGSGSRPSSSGMGWTKPAAVVVQEKEPIFQEDVPRYVSKPAAPPAVSSAVLRGEDFPSLRATLVPPAPAPSQNQKIQENSNQKPKNFANENVSVEQKKGKDVDADTNGNANANTLSHVNVNSRFNVPRTENFPVDNSRENRGFSGSRGANQDEFFPGPLPLVRLNPRFDWADDERDTGHGFTERSREGRDHGFSKSDAFWDFDMPRVGIVPQKYGSGFDKRGQL
ncbi:hypothetical protein A2U01_0027775, partial [Trifolium medium]|nr:hypothetical protein [Trifolium medium]